ncbi:uncharacterized protein LOC135470430 [Liolophura sinensis]|uniref:uncharacterized protein LOC135470430 n=1 Tax=Liolophura sinensis TaxID=3198878 RepID=UPI003158B578
MPGERLMCVWDAAFVQTSEKSDKRLTKDTLHKVVTQLRDLPSLYYSESKFQNAFKTDDDVTVAKFHRYLFEGLAERGSPQCVVQEEVENKCWELSKAMHKSKILSQENVARLWQIGNRLADVDTFPPKISGGVADWFVDKVCTHLGKNWKSTSTQVKSCDFDTLLDRLVDDFFSEETEQAVTSCIIELHSWLVLEIMKSGWLFKRTRKQANWSNWIKRWFVLSSTRMCYYDNPSLIGSGKLRGEVFMTGAKVETMPPYKGMVHKLSGRFKLSNRPYIEIELATNQRSHRQSWINSIEEVIDAAKNKTTPIQRLLRDRWSESATTKSLQLEESEQKNANAISVAHPETVVNMRKKTEPLVRAPKLSQGSSAGSDEDSFDNSVSSSLIKESNEKIKAVFMRIDADGNGKIDNDEFRKFIQGLGLKIKDREINFLFKSVVKANVDFITFQEFSEYFANVLLDESADSEAESKLRAAFLVADRDGTGTLNFKEYAEYLWDKKRSIRMSKLLTAFELMDIQQQGQVSYDQFRAFYKHPISGIPEIAEEEECAKVEQGLSAVETKLKDFYNKAEADELAHFIRERWNKFATFRRYGASGQVAMTGGHGMVDDVVPGDYSLLELACFSDLPPLVPKHNVVKGVRWEKSGRPGMSGKLIFPADFNGVLFTDTATPEHLRYYGCSFAEGNQLKISLLYRHGIQDFTYENQYLEDYVTLSNGGSGVEKHEFSHLDCPLESDSGNFILGKIVGDDELHLTAFHVPIRHTLYIPANVIHSNDYLKGTWRTMLSDEAEIDHVHLVRPNNQNKLEHFKFEFES